MKTPINSALAQSNVDFNNLKALNADLSDYAGQGLGWNPTAKQFEASGAVVSPTVTVNVKDAPYNAAGDGVTDDTTAIQTALNDVGALGGGVVFIPRGTYFVDGPFDATTNSVIKIPYNDPSTQPPIAIEIRGEVGNTHYGTAAPVGGTRILCTKIGTGTRPAVIAANAFSGAPSVPDMNHVYVYIKNLSVDVPDNPTVDGIRLETAVGASIENVSVNSTGTTQPSNGTRAITTPQINDGTMNLCRNVTAYGFDRGFEVGEHFHGSWIFAVQCNIGVVFNGVNEGSTADIGIFWCPIAVWFAGYHPTDIYLENERAVAGWSIFVRDVHDASNYAHGIIRYNLVTAGVGPVTGIVTNGGANLRFIDLNNAADQEAGSKWNFVDPADPTKKLRFSLSGITTATTRTITVRDSDITLVPVPPGGTTGQSLKKLSNADYDVGWG